MESYVGSKQITITDELKGISFPALIHYPTLEPPVSVAFGPYLMEVSPDASITEGQFPLIVISHGNGGSHYTVPYNQYAPGPARLYCDHARALREQPQ